MAHLDHRLGALMFFSLSEPKQATLVTAIFLPGPRSSPPAAGARRTRQRSGGPRDPGHHVRLDEVLQKEAISLALD